MRLRLTILALLCSLSLWGQEGFVGGNCMRTIYSGEEYLEMLLADMAQAKESINIEYYWLDTDKSGRAVCRMLVQKAREGVTVRLLMENMVVPFAREKYYQSLKKYGVQLCYVHNLERMGIFKSFGSVLGMRDHRKIVVIDEYIAYTGGMNFCDQAVYDWHDTQVRVEGPIAGYLLQCMEQSWEIAGGSPFPVQVKQADGPARMRVVTSEKGASMDHIYLKALEEAQDYFYIQTPYFCPPENILQALKDASRRGVDVRILLPERSDWGFMNELSRDYFDQLLAAGIEVALFGGAYDHSKSFVCDGKLTYVGTLNMDKRSFCLNREVGLLVDDLDVAREYTTHFEKLEAVSSHPVLGESVARGIHGPYRKFLHHLDPLF